MQNEKIEDSRSWRGGIGQPRLEVRPRDVITTGRNLWVHWWCAVPVPLSRRVVEMIRAQAAHRQGCFSCSGRREVTVPGRLDGVLRRRRAVQRPHRQGHPGRRRGAVPAYFPARRHQKRPTSANGILDDE